MNTSVHFRIELSPRARRAIPSDLVEGALKKIATECPLGEVMAANPEVAADGGPGAFHSGDIRIAGVGGFFRWLATSEDEGQILVLLGRAGEIDPVLRRLKVADSTVFYVRYRSRARRKAPKSRTYLLFTKEARE